MFTRNSWTTQYIILIKMALLNNQIEGHPTISEYSPKENVL